MTPQEKIQRNEEMEKMFVEGKNYSEIARAFNLSRERVGQILRRRSKNHKFQQITPERCIFVGLRKWLIKNRVSIKELTSLIYGNTLSENNRRLDYYIKKERPCMPKYMIDNILQATGLTYEECFAVLESEVQENDGHAENTANQ